MTACETYEIQENFFKTVDQSLIKRVPHDLQYDFFLTEGESEVEMLRKELAVVRASGHAVRRGTYAMINQQRKQIDELEERLKIIERNICNGK